MSVKAIGRKTEIEIEPAKEVSISKIIVGKIEQDLSDRKGIANEWHEIDDEIKQEIRNSWMKIIDEEIDKDYNSWN